MAHVIIGYSVPVYNRAELLDGTLSNEILCYQNFKIDIWTNAPFSQLGSRIVAPAGYYCISEPTVNPQPPKVGLYERIITFTNFTKTAENVVIDRQSGSTEGYK